MILVAGGTGRLGSRVVLQLAAQGLEMRVLTRDVARAEHLRDRAEIVVGDVTDRAAVDVAMARVDTVVSAVQGFAGPGRVSPESVDHTGNVHLVDAATMVGADVVMVSVVGAAPDHPMDLFRAKYAAERYVQGSEVGWTIVRATAFVELWAEILAKGIVFGKGDNPINFVSVDDVAAVVARTVTDTETRGSILEVGGPENVTINELMAMLAEVSGGPAKVRHLPRALLRVMARINRQPRAALAMDTIDMTFDPAAARRYPHLAMTDLTTALRGMWPAAV
ncbi:MAG: NAD(P)H-binding protein [Acidimicrobiia bacterium]